MFMAFRRNLDPIQAVLYGASLLRKSTAPLLPVVRRLGMVTTDNADFSWGGDATTPDDEFRLLHTLLLGGGTLSDTRIALARSHVTSIEPDQAWGDLVPCRVGPVRAPQRAARSRSASICGEIARHRYAWRTSATAFDRGSAKRPGIYPSEH